MIATVGARLLPMAKPDFCELLFPSIRTTSLVMQRRSKGTKSSSLRCSWLVAVLCVEKKSLIIVNIPGFPSSRSSRGMELYKLQTSRLQNPLMSSKLVV